MPTESKTFALKSLRPEEREMVLKATFGSTEFGILLTDLDHVSIACNSRFGAIFGVEIEGVVSSTVDQVREMVRKRIPDYEAWEQNLSEVYSNPAHSQNDVLSLQNPTQVIERSTRPVLDEDGNPMGRLCTFLDVTARHYERQIAELQQEISLFFHPDPKEVYSHIVSRLSAFYETTCVLSIQEGTYMHFQAISSPIPEVEQMTGNEIASSYCQFCQETLEPTLIQNALETPRFAKILPASLGITRYAGVPLREPDGQFIGTLCILDHRSDELLGEVDMHLISLMGMRVSAELERETRIKNLERDLDSATQRMIQGEKLAITGTLAASVAHDIRNIVSSIKLDAGPADPLLALHLERFEVLAHRLLSYAVPRKLLQQPVSLVEVVQRVIDLLDGHARHAKITIETEIERDAEILAEAGRIEHLFVNLLLNGIQAMRQGGTIKVLTRSTKDKITIEVRDTGPGIPSEALETIFDPFVSTRHDGFGLGLYSCKSIVQEAQGHISVTSKVGSGTTFSVEFPRA